MKVHIFNEITDKPYGGGNQFLRLLRKNLIKLALYADTIDGADIILFNSHQDAERVIALRQRYPKKVFVHRVDGPMRLYNEMSDTRDNIVYFLNQKIANGTIFQTKWSLDKNSFLGMPLNKPHAVIGNATDKDIFYSGEANKSKKIKIISASFSPNMRKGFNFYAFLDQVLDFDKYEYCFAGNNPIEFKNIKPLGCLTSPQMGDKLRDSHLYITASENDPCSNSVLEALACSLPVLALNSGGHPELLKNDMLLFNTKEELKEKIELFSKDMDKYRDLVPMQTEEQITEKYVIFFNYLLETK